MELNFGRYGNAGVHMLYSHYGYREPFNYVFKCKNIYINETKVNLINFNEVMI